MSEAQVLLAMRRALELAATPGVPLGPNPRVGCVVLDAAGTPVAEGYHRGAGHPHAEVEAMGELASRVGKDEELTAVVTLEPCRHTGRTGPCTQALLAAGVRRVVYALADPTPEASGGAAYLAERGVEVVQGVCEDAARELNRAWLFGLKQQRPLVTWKYAATLDGRSAAADGTSRWVSSTAARADTHLERARCDTIMVGTGTVLVDDPRLTVRRPDGTDLPHQLLRVVMGQRPVPPHRRVLDDAAETLLLRTRDPHRALAVLFERGQRHVFLEGGPKLAAAFLAAGLVDEVIAYLAPMLLGAGRSSVEGLDVTTISAALLLDLHSVEVLGEGPDRNVKLRLKTRPRPISDPAAAATTSPRSQRLTTTHAPQED